MGMYCLVSAKAFIESKISSKRGQGMVEYALIIAFVVVIAAGLANSDTIKKTISGIFSDLSTTLSSAAKPAA